MCRHGSATYSTLPPWRSSILPLCIVLSGCTSFVEANGFGCGIREEPTYAWMDAAGKKASGSLETSCAKSAAVLADQYVQRICRSSLEDELDLVRRDGSIVTRVEDYARIKAECSGYLINGELVVDTFPAKQRDSQLRLERDRCLRESGLTWGKYAVREQRNCVMKMF